MWAFEGRYTLSSHLRSATYPRALGTALYAVPEELDSYEDPELAVAQTVMAQLLESLRQLHAAGLVHRDVKPLNLVLDERLRVFKLIDLGACADLRTGKNYAPDETILDPKCARARACALRCLQLPAACMLADAQRLPRGRYSPPEEFLMPIDEAPDLAAASAPMALALGASAWARGCGSQPVGLARERRPAAGAERRAGCQRGRRLGAGRVATARAAQQLGGRDAAGQPQPPVSRRGAGCALFRAARRQTPAGLQVQHRAGGTARAGAPGDAGA
jgi:hypothetical protein